ncbi:MAG: nitrogenase molybdenum-iron protein [Clostridiales bacterium]|nr:nitrogenase molybdenum-iron protein [Clostridiales bacterium]
MKGLRLFLPPFAPDQSGASSVLYEMGGLLVICDAGGCAGNICGFDEPRWFTKKSAIFSAGLRDMDAILGRDDRLVDKLAQAAEKLDVSFAAVIGTPVPAVIGTDYRALVKMIEKRTGLPTLAVETTGVGLYDRGEEDAYLTLFKTFAREAYPVTRGTVGVIGATPLEFASDAPQEAIVNALLRLRDLSPTEPFICKDETNETLSLPLQADSVYCYGMGAGIDAVYRASRAEWNLVVAPSGLKTAQYLQRTFATPFLILDPSAPALLPETGFDAKRILIVHQQVTAHTLRRELRRRGFSDVTVASFFMMKKEISEAQDIHLDEEEDFIRTVSDGNFDCIIGDRTLKRMVPFYTGGWIDTPHFAISGRIS